MKPIRIVLFYLFVLAGLSLVVLVFPKDGIKLSEDNSITLPSFKDLFTVDTAEYADISNIIEIDTGTATTLAVTHDSAETKIDTVRVDPAKLKATNHKIQFPNNNKSILYPFFDQIVNIKNTKKLIRIFHYGDSQIEGDRITSFLRFRLQGLFGGQGCGLVAIKDVAPTMSVKRDQSDNWNRYTIFGHKDTNVKHSRYGMMLHFNRFAPINNDTILNDSLKYESWFSLGRSRLTYQNAQVFKNLKLYYGYNKQPFNLKVYQNEDEEPLTTDSILATNALQTKTWKFDETPDNLKFEMNGYDSPDIYGVTMDGDWGIAVDNIPLRGSSGVEFAKLDQLFFRYALNQMNVKLLIMQFGVNVVPNVKEDYAFYESWFYNNLRILKNIAPDISIIVIGVSDMSIKKGDFYETYPNIEMIRDAQKNAAFRAGCGFWDLYEAMGGKNSMPSWVFAEPPLAAKDFTHFNTAGARIVAEMFYSAFISEYNDYLNHKKKNAQAN
jgi:hypothetical protein